jgi:hypothetical protein
MVYVVQMVTKTCPICGKNGSNDGFSYPINKTTEVCEACCIKLQANRENFYIENGKVITYKKTDKLAY